MSEKKFYSLLLSDIQVNDKKYYIRNLSRNSCSEMKDMLKADSCMGCRLGDQTANQLCAELTTIMAGQGQASTVR